MIIYTSIGSFYIHFRHEALLALPCIRCNKQENMENQPKKQKNKVIGFCGMGLSIGVALVSLVGRNPALVPLFYLHVLVPLVVLGWVWIRRPAALPALQPAGAG